MPNIHDIHPGCIMHGKINTRGFKPRLAVAHFELTAMVSFDGPRTWKEMFMIISFQMLSQPANKRCVLLLDTILNCITKES